MKCQIISNPAMRQKKGEDSKQVVKEAHKEVWRKRLAIMAVLVVVIAGTVCGGCRYCRDFQYTDCTVGWERRLGRGNSGFTGYLKYGSDLLKYNKDGVSYMDSDGRDVWILSYGMKTPVAAVNRDYVVIADQQGNSIYICNKNGGVGMAMTNLPVIKVTVSARDLVAAIQEEQGSIRIDMLGRDGSPLDISIKDLTGGDVGYPLGISLSSDETRPVNSFMYIEGGSLRCWVAFCDFSETRKSIPTCFVGGFRDIYETNMIPRVRFLDEVYSCAFAGDSISFFNPGSAMSSELLVHIPTEEDVKNVFHSSDYAGVVVGTAPGECSYRMDVCEFNGEKVLSEPFSYNYRGVNIDGEHIFSYNEDSYRVYNMWGNSKFEGNFDLAISETTNGFLPNFLAVTGPQNMKKVKLQQATTLHKRWGDLPTNNLDTIPVDAIRILSADTIQKMNSDHPGLPLGVAPVVYKPQAHHMNHSPADPQWGSCGRFVLLGGHGPMLLYSLLHLFGCGDLSKEDITNFRQMGFLAPGYPEYRRTVGVEATTGPLGVGIGTMVGMTIAGPHLVAVFNKDEYPVVDHYIYMLGDDGYMVGDISSEVFSLAGALGLSEPVVFYNSSRISAEGGTNIAFMENVQMRIETSGFQTIMVEGGSDLKVVGRAIEEAKADAERPFFITVKAQIGYGCPVKQGKASTRGEPLGAENVLVLKENLGWPSRKPFCVPGGVYEDYRSLANEGAETGVAWDVMFAAYRGEYPEMEELWNQYRDTKATESLWDDETFWAQSGKPDTMRNLSGKALNYTRDKLPSLFGGFTDLTLSSKTNMPGVGDFSRETLEGCDLYSGVRELAMTVIGNGIMFHGGLRAYVAILFVFSDYVRPMVRLSALMEVSPASISTHDSIGVGKDGLTHKPIEQLAMLRAVSNFHMLHPCDTVKTAAAWYPAMISKKTPTTLVLTRRNLVSMTGSSRDALKGGYIINNCEGMTDAISTTSGSEVELTVKAKAVLGNQGTKVRVVSVPCMDLFERQTGEYKGSVLPKVMKKRVVVEAPSGFGWDEYVDLDGAHMITKGFGASGPTTQLFKYFGFTVDHIVAIIKGS